ncbi:retrovirus-related pol polyprotein from transposon TNT 1-94 [Tanacetum coccineum]
MKVEESLNVTFDESPPSTKLSPLVDDDVGEEEAIENNIKVVNNNNIKDESVEVDDVINIKESKNHPLGQCLYLRINHTHESTVIGTIWGLRNKLDENGIVSKNKASQNLCDDFAKNMHGEFEMSMMGELNFSLGLQIKQMEDEIFFNQSKYIKEMLKKFGLEDSKPTKMPMSMEIKLTKDDEADSVDSSKYRGSGYQQKDRKPSQNDKTEHGMEKTVQNQGQSPKMSKSESILKNQQSNRSRN